MTKVFVPKERRPGERRVAATPETVRRMVKAGLEVTVETGAGAAAFFSDEGYREAGARVGGGLTELWREADAVLKVAPLGPNEELGTDEAEGPRPGALVIGLLAPHQNLDMVRQLARGRVTSLSMELIPRITRAQSMDALSSQASIAGYKAAILAAERLPRYFPLLMTAAGTIPPARVVVMGGGVAGLQAVSTVKRLGAVVEVSDIRPAVKEQVESLGGRFIDLPMVESGEGEGGYAREMGEEFLRRQREIVTEHVAAAEVVIAAALVPGKPAPVLLTREMLERMQPGSVIVDLAAPEGGNCELSRPDEEVLHRGIQILAPLNLPSAMARDASTLYSRNVLALLLHMLRDGDLAVDLEDQIVAESLLTHQGRVVHPETAEKLEGVVA